MFKLESPDHKVKAKTLCLSEMLFHDALREAPQSMERFHVRNDRGEDFDIIYWDNEDDLEDLSGIPKYVKPPYMIKYLRYDETDTRT